LVCHSAGRLETHVLWLSSVCAIYLMFQLKAQTVHCQVMG